MIVTRTSLALALSLWTPISLSASCRCVDSYRGKVLLNKKLFSTDTSAAGTLEDYRAVELGGLNSGQLPLARAAFRVDGVQDGVKFAVRGRVQVRSRVRQNEVSAASRAHSAIVYIHASLRPQGVYARDDPDDDPEILFSGRFGKAFSFTDNVEVEELENCETVLSLTFRVYSNQLQKVGRGLFSRGRLYRVLPVSTDDDLNKKKYLIETAQSQFGGWTPAYLLMIRLYSAESIAWFLPQEPSERVREPSEIELFWDAQSPFGASANVTFRVSTDDFRGVEQEGENPWKCRICAPSSRLRYETVSEEVLQSFREGDISFQSLCGSGTVDLLPASFGGGLTVRIECSLDINLTRQPIWRDGHRVVFGFTRKWVENNKKMVLGFLAVLRRGGGRVEVLGGTFLKMWLDDPDAILQM